MALRHLQMCPRCDKALRAVETDQVEIDFCRSCRGVFLDRGEAEELLGVFADQTLWESSQLARRSLSSLPCPRGHGAMERVQIAFRSRAVEIERCDRCGGLWLDPGEGLSLRQLMLQASQVDSADLARDLPRQGIGGYLFQLLSGLPLELWNPTRRRPWLTRSLELALALIFVLQVVALGMAAARLPGAQVDPRALLLGGAMVPAEVLAGHRLWTVLSSMFLHAGLIHLLGNLFFLHHFGDNIEDTLGKLRFAAIYLLGGVAGNACQVLLNPASTVPVLGASGAIAAVMAAYLVLFARVKVRMVIFWFPLRFPVWIYLVIWLGFNLIGLAIEAPQVAWGAHVGGFALGLLLGWVWRLRPLHQRARARAA